jgi:hypothetical protein
LETPQGATGDVTTPRGDGVLWIIDISFAPESPAPVVRLKWFPKTGIPIETALGSIPELAPKTARLYIHTIPSAKVSEGFTNPKSASRFKLYQHLETILGRRISRFPHSVSSALEAGDLFNHTNLRSQWTEGSADCTFGIRNMNVTDASSDTMFPYSPACNVSEFGSFVRCMPLDEDKLIGMQFWFLLSQWLTSQVLNSLNRDFTSLDDKFPHQTPAWNRIVSFAFSESQRYLAVKATTRTQCAKLIMLQFLEVALDWTHLHLQQAVSAKDSLLRATENNVQNGPYVKRHMNKPVHEWHKKAMMGIATINEISQDLSDTINYLMQVIRVEIEAPLPNVSAWEGTAVPRLRALFVDTYASCEEVKKKASRLLTQEEQQYSMYTTTLGIQESESVKRLTILASMFLPLSLAIGMLSMQSRFNSLGYLLYDLVGVTVLLGYLALLLYYLLKFGRNIQARNRWKRMDETSSMFRILLKNKGLNTLGFLYWTFVLSAFLVGMFADAGLGLRILGFGSAGFVCLLPTVGFGFAMYWVISCCICIYRDDCDPFGLGDDPTDDDTDEGR